MNEKQARILELAKAVDEICSKEGIPYSLAYGSALGAVRHKGFVPWDGDMDVLVTAPVIARFREAVSKFLPEGMRYINWETEDRYCINEDRIAFVDENHEDIHLDVFIAAGAGNDPADAKRICDHARLLIKVFHCKWRRLKHASPKNRIPMAIMKPFLMLVPDHVIKSKYLKFYDTFEYDESKLVYVPGCQVRGVMPKEYLDQVIRLPFEDVMLPVFSRYDDYLTAVYGDYMTERRS